jgi:hypothetical protein
MTDMKIEYALRRASLRTESHAKIFGLSLALLWAACLVLNAASPSSRTCRQSDRDFGITGTHSVSASTHVATVADVNSRADRFETIRSKECAANQGGEEPGYS